MHAVRRMLPAGLRWRLTAWLAVVMTAAIAVVFVVVYTDTGSELRGQIDRDLAGDTAQLSQFLAAAGGRHDPGEVAAAASRYMRAQHYGATSTLLFVLIPGRGAVSNHPEVFGAAGPEDAETPAHRAKERASIRSLLVPRMGYSTRRVADVGWLRIQERPVGAGARAVIAGAGEPLASVTRAQRGVARAFVLAAALTLAIALSASYLAGARVSAPLRRMASVAARVDDGELEPRMEVANGAADEVRVLAQAFNHMLDRLADAFARQRQFTADAAHELRTPLTVIRGQLEVLAAQHAPTPSEVRRVERLVQAEIARIARLVDDLLLLAQAERTGFLHVEQLDLRSFLTQLRDSVSVTAPPHFELGPVPDGSLAADPDRLAQALRSLVLNAIDHTPRDTGPVRMEVEHAGDGGVRFAVEDNGPGIRPAQRQLVFERFHRTDAARSRAAGGAGLGLAIVSVIAAAHGGEVRAVQARKGPGARIELVLPGFLPGQLSREGRLETPAPQ